MDEKEEQIVYADDSTEKVSFLLRLRTPWLLVGLIGGIITTIFIGQFENLLSKKLELAFFIPVIVYIADAVGTQTEDIYIRNLANKKVRFVKYLTKEIALGLIMGVLFGALIAAFALVWQGSLSVALSVGLAMFVSVSIATVIALIIPALFNKEHTDPAVGSAPVKTVIQDFITILVYFLIASWIIL